jgi:hypothetical protein
MKDFNRNHEPDHEDQVIDRRVKLTGAIVLFIIILSAVVLDVLGLIEKWG